MTNWQIFPRPLRAFSPYATLAVTLLGSSLSPAVLHAQDPVTVVRTSELQRFSEQELENLLGPVALYPDALLAQVLVAATFPDQIADAAQYVRANGTATVDEQPWDVSVRAVAHYPSALNTLADKLDWTTALGQAYALQ